MPNTLQSLGVAGRLFPAILSGAKTSTIRWRETTVVPGPMTFVRDDDPSRTVVVRVTRCTEMPLSAAAAFVGRAADWPDEVLLRGMREHYPDIMLCDLVQVVEHAPPAPIG